jgi:hypothetical protein
MRQVMVRYRVSPDRARENEQLVEAVYEELRASDPAGLSYATFKLDDGLSFVHIAETAEQNPLVSLESFRSFQAGLAERCEAPPVVSELTTVGSYRMFGEALR